MITILCLVFCTNSCKKEPYPIEEPKKELLSTQLQQDFEQQKIREDLLDLSEPIKGGETLIWDIQWQSPAIKTEEKLGISYTYVPIAPRLKSGKMEVKTVLYSRYLLITKDKDGTHYSMAYAFTNNKTSAALKTRFSGTLHLKSLERAPKRIMTYTFDTGELNISKLNKTNNKLLAINGTANTNNSDCIITYRCSWTTICSGALLYVTATIGTDCIPPSTYDPCGTSSDTVPWTFTGSEEIGRQCLPPPNPTDPPVSPPTDGGGGEPTTTQPEFEPVKFNYPAVVGEDLKKQFNCFKNIPDAGATYKMQISVDLPVNTDPNKLVTVATVPPSPGHVFITLIKFGIYDFIFGMPTVTKSFGFYPSIDILSLTTGAVGSKAIDDGGREQNATWEVLLSKAEFETVMEKAIYLAGHKSYDINDYNCTDYGIEVWNSIRPDPATRLSVPDWIGPTTGLNYGRTPNGLWKTLSQKSSYGEWGIEFSSGSNLKAPGKTSACE